MQAFRSVLASWLRFFRTYPCLALVRYSRWSMLTRSTLAFLSFLTECTWSMGVQLRWWKVTSQFSRRGYARVKKMALSLARTLMPERHTLRVPSKVKKKKKKKRCKKETTTHPNNNKTPGQGQSRIRVLFPLSTCFHLHDIRFLCGKVVLHFLMWLELCQESRLVWCFFPCDSSCL